MDVIEAVACQVSRLEAREEISESAHSGPHPGEFPKDGQGSFTGMVAPFVVQVQKARQKGAASQKNAVGHSQGEEDEYGGDVAPAPPLAINQQGQESKTNNEGNHAPPGAGEHQAHRQHE